MFDLTHRTEADGSVVARAEIPCTLHLTSSDFEDRYYVKHAIQFALDTLDTASDMLIDALEEVGTNGRYTGLVLPNDLILEAKKSRGGLPADFQKFMDTYTDVYVDDDGDEWLFNGIHGNGYGDANYKQRGVTYAKIQEEFHRDLTGALVACKLWRENIARQVQRLVNECLGSPSQLWKVEIGDPVTDGNRWYDAGFHCTIWYETRVQA